MSVSKYFNPHNAAISTEPCTRSQIFGDDEAEAAGAASTLRDEFYQDELRWLEDHLRSSLVYGPSNVNLGETRPRKRWRTGEKDSDSSSSLFDFRLLSGDGSLHKINIQPKPPQAIRIVEREYEDSAKRAEVRTRQAEDAAVDFAWVMSQSRLSFPASSNNIKERRMLLASTGSLLDTSSNILVMEYPKTSVQLPLHLRTQAASPSPHGLKGRLCCPLLPVFPPSIVEGRRRRLRSSPRRRLVLDS